MSYDISSYLVNGKNIMEIELGNGWYRQKERLVEGELSFGNELIAIYEMELKQSDGESIQLTSDGSELCYSSHITFSNLFVGEIHDARVLGIPKEYRPVKPVKLDTIMLEQRCPNNKVIKKITPVFIKCIEGKRIYDVGENITGTTSIHTYAKQGDKVVIRFAEELDENGN